MKQLIYNGLLYEALEANQSLRDYSINAIKALKTWNKENPMYVGNIHDDHGHNFEIETYVEPNSEENSNYRTYFNNEKDMEITARVIEILIPNMDNIDYVDIYFEIIHELLHSIDPKSYNKELVKNPKIGPLSYQQPTGDNTKEYRNQPLERQVQLSAYADRYVQELIKINGNVKTKESINSGRILSKLPQELRSKDNDKEFLRLAHYYYSELTTNG